MDFASFFAVGGIGSLLDQVLLQETVDQIALPRVRSHFFSQRNFRSGTRLEIDAFQSFDAFCFVSSSWSACLCLFSVTR